MNKYSLLLLLMVIPGLSMAQDTRGKKKYYFLRIQENRKWGLRTFGANRKIVLPCIYDRLEDWYNGYAILGKDGKYGMIDSNAKIAVPLKYTEISDFHSGLARIRDESGKYGFINTTAQIIIPTTYDSASEFYERETGKELLTSAVTINGKHGLITNEGKNIIPVEMDMIGEFKDGMALCKKDGKFGYIGTDGQWVIPPAFAKLMPFDKGQAQASDDGAKWGIIDEHGKYILQPEYDVIKAYVDGIAQVQKNEKWGFINMGGQVIVQPEYAEEHDFHEGFAAVKYFDKTFKGKPGPSYKEVLKKGDLMTEGWGFIDKIGTQVTGPFFKEVHDFKSGIAIVTLKGANGIGYVNRKGEFKKN